MAASANRLMPIRSIRACATAKAMLRTRCTQIFFEPGFGLPKVDFARCKRRRECCHEAAHVSAHQDLHPTEVTISQAFLQFFKFRLRDAGGADHACNIMPARAGRRRADGAHENIPFIFR